MTDFKLNLKLLETLTNAFGPSGHEDEVQKITRDYGQKFADDVLFDRTGSVIFKYGNSGPKIMLAGHADEIGYIISSIDKSGFLKISNIGGIFPTHQLGQEILIRPFKGGEDIIGIIQAAFPKSMEDMKKVKPLDQLLVDVGCNSDKEVEALGIKVGDPAVPYATYRSIKRKRLIKDDNGKEEEKEVHLVVAKAFDDRIGVFMVLEILRRLSEEKTNLPNIIYSVSTVQEEIGCRGARTAAQFLQPDIGMSLDVTVSGDVPGTKNADQKMGDGVVIHAMDNSMMANPKLRRFAIKIAEENGIKWQMGFLNRGGTDAGSIHLTGAGAPSLFIGIATRYVHSHHSLLDLEDVEGAIQLIIAMLKKLDQKTVESFTTL